MYLANVNVNLMEENVIQIKSGISVNVDANVKKKHICEKCYIWNPASYSCENSKYLASIINSDLVITCSEVIEGTTVPANFNEKNQLVKHKTYIC